MTEPATKPEEHNPANEATNAQLIARLLKLTWRFRVPCIKVLIAQVLTMGLLVTQVALTGLGVDVIRYHALREGNDSIPPPEYYFGLQPPADWSPMRIVIALAGLMLVAAVFYAVLRYFAEVFRASLVLNVVVNLRTAVYDKMQRLSFRFFDSNDSGSMINRATRDVQGIRMFIEMVVVESFSLTLTLAISLAYMLVIHPWLTLACLATTPLLWLMAVMFSRSVRPQYMALRDKHDQMVNALSENLQGVRVVKGFALEGEESDRFGQRNQTVRTQHQSIFFRAATFIPSVEFATYLNLVVLLGYGGYLVIHNEIALGAGLVAFATLLRTWSENVRGIAMIANAMQRSLSGAQRVFEVLDAPVEVESPDDPVPLGRAHGHVQFENVSFSYTGRPEDAVLHDINLDIQPGECVAVLGGTGAGKSTMLSLIPRFYDPTAGRMLIDGIDLRDVDLDELRKNIGLVFQESFLFSTTVARNIAFGHPDATMEQVKKAARIACADEFIDTLENGYDTVIGENGIGLSGGQRQRLAIARAILLEPAVLLLDDPTAAVDPETEHLIMAAMDSAMQGRTTFVIAHRLSTLRRADRVIVIEEGRITQTGTHGELVESSGHYRDVARLQVADAESQRLLEMDV